MNELIRKASIEEWRTIKGFEGIYEVSNHARIRRIGPAARRGNGRGGGVILGRTINTPAAKDGYLRAMLYKDGKRYARLLHVIVAEAFLPAKPLGMETNHKDGDKANCSPDNLEWVSRSQNVRHAWAIGLQTLTRAQKAALELSKRPETRAKIAESQRGQKRSSPAYECMRQALTGRKLSPETREKMKASFTPERREAIREVNRKRAKIRQTVSGKATKLGEGA